MPLNVDPPFEGAVALLDGMVKVVNLRDTGNGRP